MNYNRDCHVSSVEALITNGRATKNVYLIKEIQTMFISLAIKFALRVMALITSVEPMSSVDISITTQRKPFLQHQTR